MCDYCDKPFPHPEELKQHMEDHLKKAQGQLDDEEQSDSDCIEANIENDEIDLEENAHENEEIDLEENQKRLEAVEDPMKDPEKMPMEMNRNMKWRLLM